MLTTSPAADRSLPGGLEQLLQHQQPDQGLGVLAALDRSIEARERDLDDLNPLLRGLLPGHVIELGGQEEPDALIGEAGARIEAIQLAPVAGGLADLLRELALSTFERRLALHIQLAGRQLQQGRLLDRLARLLDHEEGAAVVRDHADGSGMDDDLPGRPAAVGVLKGLHPHGRDRPSMDELPTDLREARVAHAVSSASVAAASASPEASAAAKNSRSSARDRPMCVVGSPLSAYSSTGASRGQSSWRAPHASPSSSSERSAPPTRGRGAGVRAGAGPRTFPSSIRSPVAVGWLRPLWRGRGSELEIRGASSVPSPRISEAGAVSGASTPPCPSSDPDPTIPGPGPA